MTPVHVLLLIVVLWPDGHRDILARKDTASMVACTESLTNAVQVVLESYEGTLFEQHDQNGNNFVMLAYCATRIGKSEKINDRLPRE